MSLHQTRQQKVQSLSEQLFDVLIIGGGITGAGIALDAASRGLKVVLLERNDFASGTSSKCTKLIHGGLRYLKQGNLSLVSKTAKEREIIYKNAPELVEKIKLVLPIYQTGTLNRFTGFCALSIYDYLAHVDDQDKKKMLSKQEMINRFPHMKQEGLIGGIEYVEYQTDDALLTFSVIKTATKFGAQCFNYCEVREIVKKDGKITGISFFDKVTKEVNQLKAKVVINATGPWVEKICLLDYMINNKIIHSKGCHIVVDSAKIPIIQSLYYDTSDGRMIFIIKKRKKVYIGTTDTLYNQTMEEIQVTKEDKKYLLDKVKEIFPYINLTTDDIEAEWAGVRPLIRENKNNMSEISRKDEIWTSASGLITVAGGKLTGYRQMAESVMNEVIKQFKWEKSPCKTKQITIATINFEINDDLSNLNKIVELLISDGEVVKLEDVYLRRLDDYYFDREKFYLYYSVLFEMLKDQYQWELIDLINFEINFL